MLGTCSWVPWERSGKWSWCCWVIQCSCKRHSAALCCEAELPGAQGTGARTSVLIAVAPTRAMSPWDYCRGTAASKLGGEWRRKKSLSLKSRGQSRSPLGAGRRPIAPEKCKAHGWWSWQCASPPGCGLWWRACEERKKSSKCINEQDSSTVYRQRQMEICSLKNRFRQINFSLRMFKNLQQTKTKTEHFPHSTTEKNYYPMKNSKPVGYNNHFLKLRETITMSEYQLISA